MMPFRLIGLSRRSRPMSQLRGPPCLLDPCSHESLSPRGCVNNNMVRYSCKSHATATTRRQVTVLGTQQQCPVVLQHVHRACLRHQRLAKPALAPPDQRAHPPPGNPRMPSKFQMKAL